VFCCLFVLFVLFHNGCKKNILVNTIFKYEGNKDIILFGIATIIITIIILIVIIIKITTTTTIIILMIIPMIIK